MDAVLGLSMTPTSVGLVLVEGQEAEGATMDRDAFTVSESALDTSEQAAAAVLRTEAMAATRGLRMHSIGVTWSEDADVEASMLMRSLSESGFDNVVAIRLPEATEALARGIADVLGYATTAVCVVEPDLVITLIVNTSDGAVQTALNHAIDSDESLTSWLSSVFARADWAPEALVVVGSAGDFEPLLPRLEEVLSVPVFAPEEAKLALARGAALASAQSSDRPLDVFGDFDMAANSETVRGRGEGRSERSRDLLLRVGPAAMLGVGVVTFVVSVSIAIGLQLSPARDSESHESVAAANVEAPAAKPSPPAMAPPVLLPPAPEQALPLPPPEAPPVVEAPVPVADVPAEAPAPEQAPAAAPDYPQPADVPTVDPGLAPVYPPPMAGTPLPPSATAPPVYTAPVPAVPTKKPGILTRIKEKLTPGPG